LDALKVPPVVAAIMAAVLAAEKETLDELGDVVPTAGMFTDASDQGYVLGAWL
jgi:hypothetical protein